MHRLLAAEEAQPLSKLLAIRFLKENLESTSYCFLKLVQAQLLPVMARIAMHQKESKSHDRGKSLFRSRTDLSARSPAELEQIGLSLHIIVLETLQVLANLFAQSPYQYHEFPSLFASYYRTLKDNGVTFPTEYSYYKPQDEERILKSLKEHDSAGNRTKEIDTFLPYIIEHARKELLEVTKGDYLELICKIASTGDSNFIQDYVKLLEQALADSSNHNETIMVLRLLNDLFTNAEFETMVLLRDTFLLKLVGTAFLVDFENEKLSQPLFETAENKAVRRLCYEMLREWQTLLDKHNTIRKDIVDGFCQDLPVAKHRLLNSADFQIEFCQNLQIHRLLNESKSNFQETMVELKEKLNRGLEYFRQLPIDKVAIIEQLMKDSEMQSPEPAMPQANIFVSRHEFFQSPSSRPPSDKAISASKSAQQQNQTSEVRVYFDASSSRNNFADQQYAPSSSSKSIKSMQRVEVPCIEIAVSQVNDKNFMKKRPMNTRANPVEAAPFDRQKLPDEVVEIVRKQTPVVNPIYEEESVIVEPSMDPLDSSFHEASEVTENMMNKLKGQQIPSFKTATTVGNFILPSKNYNEPELRANKTKVSEDMNVLRSLNPSTQRKNATELNQHSQNQLKSALDQQIDKLTRMYTQRISELERSLQQSQLKQRKYIKVIEEQRSQITSLRSEASMSVRSRVSDPAQYINEIQYLSNENKTLRNRLDRMSLTSDLSKSVRAPVDNLTSINRSVNRSQRPMEHPLVLHTKEYDLKIRKPLLRNKELLYKNDIVEVGMISCHDSGLKLTLFYTPTQKVKELLTQLEVSEPLEAIYANLHIPQCSPNRQEKQSISFKVPKSFKFEQPRLTAIITLATDETETLHLTLPVSLIKFVELVSTTVTEFKAKFRELKVRRYCTEQIVYSKRILKEHKSIQQFFPRAVHINSHREAEYNEGSKYMKYGWEAHFTNSDGVLWKFLVKAHLSRGGTMFVEAVDITDREGSGQLVQQYLADLLAVFVKESNR